MSALPAGGRVEVPAMRRLSEKQARALTERVRADVAAVWMRVLDLYEGQAHTVLGYGSWREYWEAEFGGSGTRGEQLVRAGRVARAIEAAEMPLPANDTVARELLPVLRQAPDRLPDVWGRALEFAAGRPTGRDVRELVIGYLPTDRRSASDVNAGRRRARNIVGAGLRRARAGAETAADGLEEALATAPSTERLAEWEEHAEEAYRALREVLTTLAEERT